MKSDRKTRTSRPIRITVPAAEQIESKATQTPAPALANSIENIADYNVIFLGYPIWHGQAPKIIYTFLESYDFSGKTIIPFCASPSSGIGSSTENLRCLAPDAQWKDGERFSSDTNKNNVESWVNTRNLSFENGASAGVFDFEKKTVHLNSGYEMSIMELGTSSLSDEECYNSVTALLESGGRLIDTAYMYGNAAVGRAIRDSDVPREEIFVITKIYPGEQFANSEKAIRDTLDKLNIGYINMMLLHHPGDTDVKAFLMKGNARKFLPPRVCALAFWLDFVL